MIMISLRYISDISRKFQYNFLSVNSHCSSVILPRKQTSSIFFFAGREKPFLMKKHIQAKLGGEPQCLQGMFRIGIRLDPLLMGFMDHCFWSTIMRSNWSWKCIFRVVNVHIDDTILDQCGWCTMDLISARSYVQ
jgi:hypothetical protein